MSGPVPVVGRPGDEKAATDSGGSLAHDFGCTHDPCRCGDAAQVTELVDKRGCLWVIWQAIACFPEIARREWKDMHR